MNHTDIVFKLPEGQGKQVINDFFLMWENNFMLIIDVNWVC